MTDILRKSMAPLTDAAWAVVDEQARRTLRGNLSARRVVDFSGPHGWEYAAVNLGRVKPAAKEALPGVAWGVRQTQPMVEARVPFALGLWELDDITRGARDLDLGALCVAARKAAIFEETALYRGFESGGITGILQATPHKAVAVSARAEALATAVETGLVEIEKAGVGGPFALALGTELYPVLMAGESSGYPVRKRIEAFFKSVHWSPVVTGGVILSARGGDFELTVGQDWGVGYQAHDTENVRLYLTQSFTFRVIEPAAAIELKLKK